LFVPHQLISAHRPLISEPLPTALWAPQALKTLSAVSHPVTDIKILQKRLPQAPGIRIARMIYPGLNVGIKLGKADCAVLPLCVSAAKVLGGVP
jgi:hypothetical protein